MRSFRESLEKEAVAARFLLHHSLTENFMQNYLWFSFVLFHLIVSIDIKAYTDYILQNLVLFSSHFRKHIFAYRNF